MMGSRDALRTIAAYLERVHPDDRDRVRAEVERAYAQGGLFEFEERIVRRILVPVYVEELDLVAAGTRAQGRVAVAQALDGWVRIRTLRGDRTADHRFPWTR